MIGFKSKVPTLFVGPSPGPGNSTIGKVGIGTTNPSERLDVSGFINSGGYKLNGTQVVFSQWISSGSNIYWSGSNLGIGTSAPSEKLEVRGSGMFTNNGSSSDYIRIGHDGANAIFDAYGSGGLLINYYSHKDVSIHGQLDVCKKLLVHPTSWCDFAFEDNYQLKSIFEIEKELKEKKHLPYLPSAKEIEIQGINVPEMFSKQTLSIEVAYLYIIELNKKIEKMQNELVELKIRK